MPTQGLNQVDPFLMLDEVGTVIYGPEEALGAPYHPHRGFETVFYILQGEKLHKDSTGKTQLIGPGDVQRMTAGAGIVYSELFPIWVNLPTRDKFATPGYQYLLAHKIPTAESPDGKVHVTVIAGEAFGVRAAIGTHTPIWLQDWQVQTGAETTIPLDATFNAAAYVFNGTVAFRPQSKEVQQGHMAVFGPGDSLQVACQGPFVMNTEEELRSAIDDYRRGRMGIIDIA